MKDDLISRQAAIDAVIEITYDQTALHHGRVSPYYVVNRLEYLPSAEKKGEWEVINEKEEVYSCSECGFVAWGKGEISNYCPNCGARMEESDG